MLQCAGKKVKKISDSHKQNGNGLKGTCHTRNKMSVDEVFTLVSWSGIEIMAFWKINDIQPKSLRPYCKSDLKNNKSIHKHHMSRVLENV